MSGGTGGATNGAGYMIHGHASSEFERSAFRHERMMANTRSLIPVKVVKVYKIDGKTEKSQGDVEEAGFVDVQPLISQVDGQGNKMDHTTIYHIPYTRVYGGSAAIIMDPTPGDVGYVKVADRDISSFKDGYAGGSSASSYTPNSRRRHDLADSVYLGGILSKIPKMYITFRKDGSVAIGDKNGNVVLMNDQGISLTPFNGKVQINGTLNATGNVVAGYKTGDQVDLQQHLHSNAGGTGNSGPPVAGT